jgi:hypothetical protein
LEIQLRDEFGNLVENIEVNYTWAGEPGTFTFNETSGYYTALLSEVPEGVFDIVITAEKGPNYDFDEYVITISSTTKLSVWQLVLIYMLAAAVIALISGFGAYQLHFKYPPLVRDVRDLRRKLGKGRKTKPLLVDSKAKIMDRIFQDQLKNSNIKSVKVKKSGKISRTDKDIKEITDKDSIKKAEKPVPVTKLPEEIKEKEKVEKVPDKKKDKKIAEQEKKSKEKAEKDKNAKEKAAKKVAKKEEKLKVKTAEKEKAVMEKIAQEAAVKAKKVEESPVKVGKKEEAKVKMSKISLPKKKSKK